MSVLAEAVRHDYDRLSHLELDMTAQQMLLVSFASFVVG